MNEQELDSVHHLAINVANVDLAVQWYTTSFNCEIESQSDTQAMLRFGNVRLQILLPSQTPPHLAFEREDANTFGELREGRDGTLSTYVSDPTGNPVEIVQPAVK